MNNRTIDQTTLKKWIDFMGEHFTDGKVIRCVCGKIHKINKHKRTAKKFIKCDSFDLKVESMSFNHLVDKWINSQVEIIDAITQAQKDFKENNDLMEEKNEDSI